VINRAYYALHDTVTPLWASVMNIVLNIAVEVPLMWWMGEAAIALGTMVSFIVQAILMIYLLDRRLGGLGAGELTKTVSKMLIATLVMGLAVWAITLTPIYPKAETREAWVIQLAIQVGLAVVVYFTACQLLGVNLLSQLRRKR